MNLLLDKKKYPTCPVKVGDVLPLANGYNAPASVVGVQEEPDRWIVATTTDLTERFRHILMEREKENEN